MKTWNAYRWNGEYVTTVQAASADEALAIAWRKYFGDTNGILKPRNDGTLTVSPE